MRGRLVRARTFILAAILASIVLTLAVNYLWTNFGSTQFHWPKSGVVHVTELIHMGTGTNTSQLEMKYELHCSAGSASQLSVKPSNYEVVKFNGEPLSPADKKPFAPQMKSFNARPAFVVDRQGELKELSGFGEAVRATGEMKETISGGATTAEEFVRNLQDPLRRKLSRKPYVETWGAWVELWGGFPASAGETFKTKVYYELPDSSEIITGRLTCEHLGPASGSQNLVHLRSRFSVYNHYRGDHYLGDSIVSMMRVSDRENKRSADPELDKRNTMPFASYIFEVKIDPTTLRPSWAKRETRYYVMVGGQRMPDMGAREYFFKWD